MAGKAAELVTLVLLATVVPRALGPHDYGRFAVPLSVVTLGSLAMTLGGPTLMVRYVPAAAPGHRVALARALGARLARGRAVQLSAVALAAAAAAFAAPATFPPGITTVVVVALVVNVAASLALQLPLGLGRAGPWSARFPLQNGVLVAAGLGLHPWAGSAGADAALIVAALAAGLLAAIAVAPVLAARGEPVPIPPGAIRFGALNAAGAALVQCAHRGGVLAVAVLGASAAETGYAALATGVTLGLTYAVLQAFTVAVPHLASGAEDGGAHPGEASLRRLACGLVAGLVPACLLGVLLLDHAVPLVFGDAYDAAVPAFGPAAATVVLAPLSALAVQAGALRLRPESALASGGATAVGFLAAATALVPHHGALGATAAALAGTAVGAIVAVVLLPRAAGARLVAASFGGAALVLGASLLA